MSHIREEYCKGFTGFCLSCFCICSWVRISQYSGWTFLWSHVFLKDLSITPETWKSLSMDLLWFSFLIIIYVAFDQAENTWIWFNILVRVVAAEGVLFCYLRSLLILSHTTNSLSQWNSCSCAVHGLKRSCYFRLAQMVPLLMHHDSSSGLRRGSVSVVLTGDHSQVCGDNSGSVVSVSVSLTCHEYMYILPVRNCDVFLHGVFCFYCFSVFCGQSLMLTATLGNKLLIVTGFCTWLHAHPCPR